MLGSNGNCVALPHGAVGWSAVCDCGISRSYSLFFLNKSHIVMVRMQNINEPRHEISNNVVCATSKASDQPAHTRSLTRAFARRLNML